MHQLHTIDLRIGRHFRVFATPVPIHRLRKPMEDLTELVEGDGRRSPHLHPGEFVLGTPSSGSPSPDDGWKAGRQELARALGLPHPQHRGFVDAGLAGN